MAEMTDLAQLRAGTRGATPVPQEGVVRRPQRRAILVALVAGTLLVLLASAAAACIPWRGEVTVTPWDTTNLDVSSDWRGSG